MKKLLSLAALAAASLAPLASAHAEVIGYIGNNAGGAVNFTDMRQNCAPGTFYVYATSGTSSQILEGCWNTVGDQNRVYYPASRNPVSMYPLARIMVTPYGAANGWKAPSPSDERARPAPAPASGASL